MNRRALSLNELVDAGMLDSPWMLVWFLELDYDPAIAKGDGGGVRRVGASGKHSEDELRDAHAAGG
jgi:hypothetical protein